jgi:hypothetical protein
LLSLQLGNSALSDVDALLSEHLQTIFASEELLENSVVRNFRNTAADGKYLPHFKAVRAKGANTER